MNPSGFYVDPFFTLLRDIPSGGIGEGIKKEPEGCLFDFLPAHLLRWRLPTLPLAQYHRRDGA